MERDGALTPFVKRILEDILEGEIKITCRLKAKKITEEIEEIQRLYGQV
ncbi:hypothetical protein [Wolbachia endosymbiont of Trichogramma pretiosum]|nr:hypothetical protein wTpre_981 [Wolbachia endosymbiont of Trichogramma pretiosum]